MTTRRSLLRLAGGAAGAAVLAGCSPRATTTAPPKRDADLLFATTSAGLTVLRADTGEATLASSATLATADWTRVVGARPEGSGTRVVTQEPKTGQVISGGTYRDRLEPRVVSPNGRLVALATPGPRDRTTIVVVDSGGERVRLDLAGNLEPEAFSTQGDFLYVLDHLPPRQPDRYRVRQVDLQAREVRPLQTKDKFPVPTGAEEEMRGQGRQAVYDERRKMLFTLYTHQPDHLHTRDLVRGARDGVHAFVHSLSLDASWAFCVDLPAPFGEGPAAGHAIVRTPGGLLLVVDANTGLVARIDPDALTVLRVDRFADRDPGGEAYVRSTTGEELIVAAGTSVLGTTTNRRIDLTSPARGLATGAGTSIWVGQEGAAVRYDLAAGKETARVAVPGLVALRHVIPVA